MSLGCLFPVEGCNRQVSFAAELIWVDCIEFLIVAVVRVNILGSVVYFRVAVGPSFAVNFVCFGSFDCC